ncbi:hypothetical protein IHQ71_24190 [Rhizobium sp. TH2]|uniref:hypothetical protein n=1 Tax=Rhizobium sp. TH2 TaxID=2775403 RepID=UPI00215812F5|nr:hypothetical protein [Rhizobium sp. TH2]UVC08221.1 hypothetical protein IHQ71_24190 [Rhizobium sp. TH2]
MLYPAELRDHPRHSIQKKQRFAKGLERNGVDLRRALHISLNFQPCSRGNSGEHGDVGKQHQRMSKDIHKELKN